MEKVMYMCDSCGEKETIDPQETPGWIRMFGLEKMVLFKEKPGQMHSIHFQYDPQDPEDGGKLDFCSRDCLMEYFERLVTFAEESNKPESEARSIPKEQEEE